MPRVNRAIELLSQDQPIYYHTTQDLTFEGGKKAADTWADFINVDMEHHPFDVRGLTAYQVNPMLIMTTWNTLVGPDHIGEYLGKLNAKPAGGSHG